MGALGSLQNHRRFDQEDREKDKEGDWSGVEGMVDEKAHVISDSNGFKVLI
jgi:hypothetical protein